MSVINAITTASISPVVTGRDASSSLSSPVAPQVAMQIDTPRDVAARAAAQDRLVLPPSKAQVNQALEDLIKRQQDSPTSVRFSVDEKLNQVVIKVVDPATQKVIKQFPAEAILKMREEMLDFDTKPPAGLLLSEKT